MSGQLNGTTCRAEIYTKRDGNLGVRVETYRRKHVVWVYADRQSNGKITYDQPEKISRKVDVHVRALYREIERRTLGLDRSPDDPGRRKHGR